ncbi:MAG: arginine--tRNA ligase [Candidatus Saganbacteria bacterium]|nr:arginine--tRNA ligase [Candidatus Saganbacteria bacterium]
MRERIIEIIRSATGINEIDLEVPKEKKFGDFSTNIAMSAAKLQGKNSRETANDFKKKIEDNDKQNLIKKVEIAGPGFINLFINDAEINAGLNGIIREGGAYGANNTGNGKKVLIEFVSANPTGPLHIGHGRWAVIGSSLAEILKANGYSVETEFYVNNIGRQVDLLVESVLSSVKDLEIPEGGYGGSYVKDIAEEIKKEAPEDVKQYIFDRIICGQKQTLLDAGVEFDNWFFENTLHENGAVAKTIERLKKNDMTYEKDGAVWFRSEQFGDDKDRVLVRENGEPTYFTADIAYHSDKFKRGYDLLINVWGTDHHGYVKRLQSAMEALKLPSHRLEIIIGQLVTLYRGKEPVRMSKRTGEMITLKEVIDEIGCDAARFFLLMTGADTHMDFDLELAKKRSLDNPVYYIQYAYARICNILKNSVVPVPQPEQADLSLLKEEAERDIILKLTEYPKELEEAAKAMQPHHLVRYLRQVASLFHSYYHKCRVICEDKEVMKARLLLIESTRIVLLNVLKLLKVSAPERM